MKTSHWNLLVVLTVSVLAVIIFVLPSQLNFVKPYMRLNEFRPKPLRVDDTQNITNATRTQVHVAITACRDRLGDVLVLAVSLALTASNTVVLHAFLEKPLQNQFKNAMNAWPDHLKQKLQIDIRDIFFPTRIVNGIPPDFWPRNFPQCAYQTLFMPEALWELDRVIYVDADCLFLSPVEDLWDQVTKFDTNQFLGITVEQNSGGHSFYMKNRRHPFYGKLGLNTGMVLFDLKKMDRTQFLVDIKNIFVEYRARLMLMDQGILNTMLYLNPERVREITCAWNYREDFCPNATCTDAQETGARLLHGNRMAFHTNNVPIFKAVFVAFRETPKKDISVEKVLSRLTSELSKPGISGKTCGAKLDIVTLQLQRIVDDRELVDKRR